MCTLLHASQHLRAEFSFRFKPSLILHKHLLLSQYSFKKFLKWGKQVWIMIGKTQELKYNLRRTTTATNWWHSSEARKKTKSKQKIKNKKVKATLSTTEEKVAEHHRICLLRSFPAKRSKTSRPAQQLRKGLVNNIKPYAVYLFIHFFFFFTSTHTVTSFLLDLSSVFQMGRNWRCESEPYAPVSRGR